jgi:hypothetical protein
LLHKIVFDSNTEFDGMTLTEYLANQNVDSPDQAVEHFETVLMAVPIQEELKAKFVHSFAASSGDRERSFRQLLHGIASLPEFQLG